MMGKVKAAMPGRQYRHTKLKPGQTTRLTAGGQTLHSPVLARSNYHQGFKIRSGVQNLCSPVWGCSNHDEVAASYLHNSIRVAQTLCRRNSYAQISSACLAPGQRNPLNQRNYSETRELANWLILFNSVDPTESVNCGAKRYADNKREQYSGSVQNNVIRGLEVPTNNVGSCEDSQPSLRGEVRNLQVTKSHSQNSPEIIGSVTYETFVGNRITDSNSVPAKKKGRASNPTLWLVGHRQTTGNPAVNSTLVVKGGILPLGYSDALTFLRWRRLISPLIEATTKPAVLSPSSFTFSSSPINSNGTLDTICCDLLFLEPVAMSEFPFDRWHSVYAKINHNQGLKVAFTLFYGKCMPPVNGKHKWQRPGVLGTTTEASNHNVIGANNMADLQHTQTRPKFQYRFLALSATACNIISIVATTEREARKQSPAGCVMVFAGRLPVHTFQFLPGKGGRKITPPSTITKIMTVQEVRHA